MRQKLFTILAVLAIMSIMALPVYAFNVRLTSVDFGLSSREASGPLDMNGGSDKVDRLIVRGRLDGLNEHRDIIVAVEATGAAEMTCLTATGAPMPGTYTKDVDGKGSLLLPFHDYFNNEMHAFRMETEKLRTDTFLAGCPSGAAGVSNVFVAWEDVLVSVKAADNGELLLEERFTCWTMPGCIRCSPKD